VGGERKECWDRTEREIIKRGMSPEGMHLAALSEMEGWRATPSELAQHMGKDRREVRRMLNRLARAGWVRKVRGETYAIASELWTEAEGDLRSLRVLREEAEHSGPRRPTSICCTSVQRCARANTRHSVRMLIRGEGSRSLQSQSFVEGPANLTSECVGAVADLGVCRSRRNGSYHLLRSYAAQGAAPRLQRRLSWL